MGAGLAGGCVLVWLTALTVYDLRQRRLPNALTLPGAATILIAAAFAGRGQPALLGALALATLYLGVHLMAPAAMGAGDVKLAVGLGALTGAFGVDVWMLAAIAAPLLTAGWGVLVLRGRRTGVPGAGTSNTVPHGPSMCVAAFAAVALVVL